VTPEAGRAYDEFRHLRCEVEEGVATVTLAPVAHDDFERSSFADLRDVWTPLSRDRGVRAVVLASSAATFNPSQPASSMAALRAASLYDRAGRLLTVQQVAAQMLTFRKPVVAAVNGPAYGLGAQLAFFADAAVATPAVVFGDSHVEHGLAAGDGGTSLWPLIVGVPLARRVVAQGHVISVEQALDLGLVEQIVEPVDLLATAAAAARRLADLPQLPFAASKLAINNWLRFSSLISWDVAAAYEAAGLSEHGG
jgi:enoyl-CoA hydratase